MTVLGAVIYGGFFAIAALWLFLTSDYAGFRRGDRQDQAPERSNSDSTFAADEVASPLVLSHSSSK
jgi:hypothetical protein